MLHCGVLGSSGQTAVLGSSAAGADAGDRALVPSGGEALCFNVALPVSATNSSQGLSSTASFTIDAEQTANNP